MHVGVASYGIVILGYARKNASEETKRQGSRSRRRFIKVLERERSTEKGCVTNTSFPNTDDVRERLKIE